MKINYYNSLNAKTQKHEWQLQIILWHNFPEFGDLTKKKLTKKQFLVSCLQCCTNDMSLSNTTPRFPRLGLTDWPKSPKYWFNPGIDSSGAITNVSVLSTFSCKVLSLSHCFISTKQWTKEFSLWSSVGFKELDIISKYVVWNIRESLDDFSQRDQIQQ